VVNSPRVNPAAVLSSPQGRDRDLPPFPPQSEAASTHTQQLRSSPEPLLPANNTILASRDRPVANSLYDDRTPRRMAVSPGHMASPPASGYDLDGHPSRYPTFPRPRTALVQNMDGALSRGQTMVGGPTSPRPVFEPINITVSFILVKSFILFDRDL